MKYQIFYSFLFVIAVVWQNLPSTVRGDHRVRFAGNLRHDQAGREAGGTQLRPTADRGGLQVKRMYNRYKLIAKEDRQRETSFL